MLEEEINDLGLLGHGGPVPGRREVDARVPELPDHERAFHPRREREAHLEEDDAARTKRGAVSEKEDVERERVDKPKRVEVGLPVVIVATDLP